jgi:hypothetical protein
MEVAEVAATTRSDGGIEVNTYWNQYAYWNAKGESRIIIFKDTMSSKRLIVLLWAGGDVVAKDVVVFKTKKEAEDALSRAQNQNQLIVE